MTDLTPQRLAELRAAYCFKRVRTHWEGCETTHAGCAVAVLLAGIAERDATIERLKAERDRTEAMTLALNAHQHRRDVHPYTCGNDSTHRPLIATAAGWRCADCDYRQPIDPDLLVFAKLVSDPTALDRLRNAYESNNLVE